MFFRRERHREPGFSERLEGLGRSGFTVASLDGGVAQVSRGNCALAVEEHDGKIRVARRAGILVAGEIANLVDGGFQKFFRTASGREKPALAEELKAIHEFEEDLKEALGLTSLYNESLGTVSTFYLYDRVKDRDRGVPRRPWEN
jgi:hypothetical protein